MKKILVIGAGPAGLLAAGIAANSGATVDLLERNDRPGRKLMITGKGRCNVTHNSTLINELIDNVPTNGRFLFGAFSRFTPYDTMDFFESAGVPLKIERGGRVFPQSDKAVDIVDALVRYVKKSGVRILKGRAVHFQTADGKLLSVQTEDGKILTYDAYILATGGKSYPATGSTGDGYHLAKEAGHTIVPPKPSLVPLELENGSWRSLQGLSLKNIAIRVLKTESYTTVYEDFGEMIFTHFGVSGPVILSASAHLRDITRGRYTLEIDLKPALDEKKLDARLQREIRAASAKSMSSVMTTLLPKALVPIILENAEVSPMQIAGALTKQNRLSLVYALKNLSYPIRSVRPIEEAIVTSGGIHVREIDPKTMRSKKCENLYFAGEVMDVDAYTGGFNLQIAFSTGYTAGKSAAEEGEI